MSMVITSDNNRIIFGSEDSAIWVWDLPDEFEMNSAEQKFEYDVIMSYSSKDKKTVDALAKRLSEDGLNIWFMEPGESRSSAFPNALERSRVLLMFISQEYVESVWKDEKSDLMIFMVPHSQHRFIPLLIEDCIIPDIIAEFSYLDWRTPSNEAYNSLLNALRNKNAKTPKRFPEQLGNQAETLSSNSHTSNATVDVPIIILAMTKDEAESIQSGKIFDDPIVANNERNRFNELKKYIDINNILASNYSEDRDRWLPGIHLNETIEDIIIQVIDSINHNMANKIDYGGQTINVRMLSTEFFINDSAKRVLIWKELGDSGALFIIDAISMFHPILRQMLMKSGLEMRENVGFIVINPLRSYANDERNPINNIFKEDLEYLYHRHSDKYDLLVELDIKDIISLKRSIYAMISKILPEIQSPKINKNNKEFLKKFNGSQGIKGFQSVIFGEENRSVRR
jgi:hypothetical protein